MRVNVVGGGRMGLPLACSFASRGAHVTVSDVNGALVSAICAGDCPYDEPGLAQLMTSLHQCGRLTATTNTAEATRGSDAIVVIVPAHLTPEREIDYSILVAASVEIGRGLRPGALVVYETTVSLGGTRSQLIPMLEQFSKLKAGRDFYVGYSPERVKANLVLERLENTAKVVGGYDLVSLERASSFYKRYLGAPVTEVGTIEAAEMTKLVGMLYRDVNIALANELAAYCELSGVDFDKVRSAANDDGEANLLMPGIGVGGHCTPVYPYFLTRESRRMGLPQRLSESAREINDRQPARQLARVKASWRSLKGKKVHILGLGFRPGVKVDTFSPAYALWSELLDQGAFPTISDPYYTSEEILSLGLTPGIAEGSNLVVLNTAHPEYATPNFIAWKDSGVEVVLDGRNLWNRGDVENSGVIYFGIGRSARIESVLRDKIVSGE